MWLVDLKIWLVGNDEREKVNYTCQKINGVGLILGLIVRPKYHHS